MNNTIEAIKAKYCSDGEGVSFAVDIEALRESANNILQGAEELATDMKRAAKESSMDRSWISHRKDRLARRISETRRNVDLAQKFLGEISGILDKAKDTMAKAKQ